MKTIQEWYESMPVNIRQACMTNATSTKSKNNAYTLSSRVATMAAAIDRGFTWALTPERRDFWSSLHNALLAYDSFGEPLTEFQWPLLPGHSDPTIPIGLESRSYLRL